MKMGIIARRAILGLFLFTLGPAFVGANFSVVRGRSDAEPQPGEEAEMCAAPDELHEVRCCSDRQLPGFTQQNGCGVWAESQFSGGIGCVENVDHQTALELCAVVSDPDDPSFHARLCTVDEMQRDCTAGTGCNHDFDLIWTSESCDGGSPPPPPPTSKWTVRGRSTSSGLEGEEPAYCALLDDEHEVRCCSDTELPGFQQRNGCSVWAESQFASVGSGAAGCVHEASFAMASSTCEEAGARLCTVDEMERDCTAGTGCAHDEDLIWTSDDCDKGCSTAAVCPVGWRSTNAGDLCIEEEIQPPGTMHESAIPNCQAKGARVCSFLDMMTACGIPNFNPFADTAAGWYGEHGVGLDGVWDDRYGVWNVDHCLTNTDEHQDWGSDGAAQNGNSESMPFKCCKGGSLVPQNTMAVSGDVEVSDRQCRGDFVQAGPQLCITSAPFDAASMMGEAGALATCQNLQARVCSHMDMMTACGAMNPFAGVNGGWFADHGLATDGNWDDEYGTWNRDYCTGNNDGRAFDGNDGSFQFRCCTGTQLFVPAQFGLMFPVGFTDPVGWKCTDSGDVCVEEEMQPAGGGDSGTNACLAGAGVSSAATTTAATGHSRSSARMNQILPLRRVSNRAIDRLD